MTKIFAFIGLIWLVTACEPVYVDPKLGECPPARSPEGAECAEASDCGEELAPGTCYLIRCVEGHCTTRDLPLGTTCTTCDERAGQCGDGGLCMSLPPSP